MCDPMSNMAETDQIFSFRSGVPHERPFTHEGNHFLVFCRKDLCEARVKPKVSSYLADGPPKQAISS